jgi:hypothetical protein
MNRMNYQRTEADQARLSIQSINGWRWLLWTSIGAFMQVCYFIGLLGIGLGFVFDNLKAVLPHFW